VEFLRDLQRGDDERTEALRAIGGVLIALAAVVIVLRKSSGADPWGDLPLLIFLAVPALILFGGGLAGAQGADLPRPWHAVWLVAGVVLIYLACLQMIEVVEGDADAPLNVAWTWAVVAVAALIVAREAFVRFGWLAAGVAAGIAFLALCEEVLPDGIGEDIGTFRNVCMVLTVALLAAAYMTWRAGLTDEDEASELLTAAAIYFVIGTTITGLTVLFVGASLNFAPAAAAPVDRSAVPDPSTFWDTVLGLGSVALVVAGAILEKRGPAYVGAVGLVVFALIVGVDLDNSDRDGSLVGWPLVLTLAAIAAVIASALRSTDEGLPTNPDQGHTPWSS
jgi:hypothetical protein